MSMNPVGRPRITIDIAVLGKLAAYGMTQTAIADVLGISEATFRDRLGNDPSFASAYRDGKARAPKRQGAPANYLAITPQELKRQGASGALLQDVAAELGISRDVLRHRLTLHPKHAAAWAAGQSLATKFKLDIEPEALRRRAASGALLQDIAIEHGMTRDRFRRRMSAIQAQAWKQGQVEAKVPKAA